MTCPPRARTFFSSLLGNWMGNYGPREVIHADNEPRHATALPSDAQRQAFVLRLVGRADGHL